MTVSETQQSGIAKFKIVVDHDAVTEADIRRILDRGGLRTGTYEVQEK